VADAQLKQARGNASVFRSRTAITGISVFRLVVTLDVSIRLAFSASFGKWSRLLTKQVILQGACDSSAPEYELAAC